jgi:2-polyprenyl-3-methyl-5-hydroxy-6-metoxy-1,4-benzoquinol methylase
MHKALLNIVGSGFKDIAELEASGSRWLEAFQRLGYLKPSYRILDFGAGLGRISIPFSKACRELVAIDGNPNMVAVLKEHKIKAFLGDNCDMVKGPFDFIVTSYVLQHIPWGKTIDLIGQFSKLTDVLFFTYPTYERCEKRINDTYTAPEKAGDLPVEESHNCSRIIHLADIGKLFVKSDFDVRTLKPIPGIGSNLFRISKGGK